MRPVTALCLLAAFATAASLCNRSLCGRRQQALSSRPVRPVRPIRERRPLTPEEAVRLGVGRSVAEVVIQAGWPGMSAEEAARLATAWPALTPSVSRRLQ